MNYLGTILCLNPLGGSFVSKMMSNISELRSRLQESLNPLGGSFVSKMMSNISELRSRLQESLNPLGGSFVSKIKKEQAQKAKEELS